MSDTEQNKQLHALANRIWSYRDQMDRLRRHRTMISERLRLAMATEIAPDQKASWDRRLNLWRAEYRMTDDLLSEINASETIAVNSYGKILKTPPKP